MLVWLFLCLGFPLFTTALISCYGDYGKVVDWFIVYKLPKDKKQKEGGIYYMYQDGDTRGWVPGKSVMNRTDSAVGRTLSQLYDVSNTKDVAYVLYNDQPPRYTASAIRGHTKGVVLLDSKQGFWLVHSTPHFPPPVNMKYDWPTNAFHNGQSFLCVTYSYNQFKDIGTQLLYNTISSYDSSIPETFSCDFPDLKAAAEDKQVTSRPWNRSVTLMSAGGKEFTSFSKTGKFRNDLYSGWLSEVLQSALYVQFWRNSAGILPSDCSIPHHVYNIDYIAFSQAHNFSTHIDHSKWCVTDSGTPGWACVGDMNRNKEEERRGGGTVCIKDPVVWKSFNRLVSVYSNCEQVPND
ncbi:deoxyribonuclease-2-alpha [Bombina bombina]|uniref:deoxyribonuclease-2-alpha n=1 Tax=Bombina bombina TaxID=8345 RepID=UPI00235AB4D1|nr:deoxyribonuclease-2-alpha [Bombina bombina]XP_053573823.1 deoxyribonuclease-2-alpha [Bombina bombina]